MGLFDVFRRLTSTADQVDTRLEGHEVSVVVGSPATDYERAKAKLARLKAWVAEQDAKASSKVTEAHRKQIRILEAVLS